MTPRTRHADAWRVLTWCAVGAFAAFRLAELTRYALWYDEIFSFSLAQRGWNDLLSAAIADRTNPPLFYLLLKLWIGIGGESVAWMRLLPCAAGIGVAVPLVALARRAFEIPVGGDAPVGSRAAPGLPASSSGTRAAQMAAVAAVAAGAASSLLVALSNELRGYSFLLLFTTLSLLAFGRLARTATLARSETPPAPANIGRELRRAVAMLVVVNTALVYTHYFGWLVVAGEVGAALFWNRCALRPALLAAAVTAVAFAPWAAAVLSVAGGAVRPLSNVDWISRPSLADVPVFYDALVARVLTPSTAFVGALIVGALLAGLLFQASRRTPDGRLRRRAAVLLWFAAFPVAVVFLVSVLAGRSAFVPRYLVVAAPAWWLLLGMAVAGSRPVVAAALFSAFTLAAGVMREVRGGEKIQWNALVDAIAHDAGPTGGAVYSLEGFTALPLAYYAASTAVPLKVRPVRELSAIEAPAWLVVRSTPGSGAGTLGGALIPRGVSLRLIDTAAIPSQKIDVYRVEPQAASP